MANPAKRVGTHLVRMAAVSVLVGSFARAADAPAGMAQLYQFHHAEVLGTSLDLSVVATSKSAAETAEKTVLAEVERLRRILSSYDSNAELARLNASPVGGPGIEVSQELIDVLKQYDTWSQKTQGSYSGHAGELIALWKNAEKKKKLPADDDLLAAAKRTVERAWEIDEAKKTVRRVSDQQINVDSLGKGYIVGKAVAAATKGQTQLNGLLLNIGGDIRVWGSPLGKAGAPWAVGVADPKKPELNAKPLTTVYVFGDHAIATSGDYQRFYTITNKRYSHIVDAHTGKPARQQSATVIAPDSATANALATACCILKVGEAFDLVRSVPDAECMIITADGTPMRTDGFRDLEAPANAVAAGPKQPSQFPAGYKFAIDLETTATQRKPYVIAWITSAEGKHVKTLGAWGNETKWLREMHEWWKIAGNDKKLLATTHATQRAGKYPLTWDGTDQSGSGVPAGKYNVWVEVGSEHGPYAARSGSITIGKNPTSATIAATSAFKDVSITFGPGSK